MSSKSNANFTSSPEALKAKILEMERKLQKLESTVSFLRSRIPISSSLVQPELSAEYSWALIPDEEKLLLSCTACGAMFGLSMGRIIRQTYLGAVFGAVAAVFFANRSNWIGAWVRAAGKLLIIILMWLREMQREFLMKWKAWRVYERSFKGLESIDKQYEISRKIMRLDSRYRISDTLESTIKTWDKTWREAILPKIDVGLKNVTQLASETYRTLAQTAELQRLTALLQNSTSTRSKQG